SPSFSTNFRYSLIYLTPSFFSFLYFPLRLPPISTLFPYTTLFRSVSRPPPALFLRPADVTRLRAPERLTFQKKVESENRAAVHRSEEHTSELQSPDHLVCRLLLEKKKKKKNIQ